MWGMDTTPNPTLAYISFFLGVVLNMLRTLNEKKVTVGQSGAVFLLIFLPFILTFLVSASSRLPVCLFPYFLS